MNQLIIPKQQIVYLSEKHIVWKSACSVNIINKEMQPSQNFCRHEKNKK